MIKNNFLDLCLCPRRYAINTDKEFKEKLKHLLISLDQWPNFLDLLEEGNFVEKFLFNCLCADLKGRLWFSSLPRTAYQQRAEEFIVAFKNPQYLYFYHPLFLYNTPQKENFFLEVDLLKKDPHDNSLLVNELKASTKPKFVNFLDLLYQGYVLKKLNYNVKNLRLILLNSRFNLQKEGDYKDLFIFVSACNVYKKALTKNPIISQLYLSQFLNDNYPNKVANLTDNFMDDACSLYDAIDEFLQNNFYIKTDFKNNYQLPKAHFAPRCNINGMACNYTNFCRFHIDKENPNNSIRNMYRLPVTKANAIIKEKNAIQLSSLEYHELEKQSFALGNKKINFNFTNLLQFYIIKEQKNLFVDYINLSLLLDEYKFPLYFFDFEAVDFSVPVFLKTRPYQHIPFQYSCHVILSNNIDLDELLTNKTAKNVFHYEYLSDCDTTALEQFVVNFIHNMFVHGAGKYVAYHKVYECTILKTLQSLCDPKYFKELQYIIDNLIDLKDLFSINSTSATNYLNGGTNYSFDHNFANLIHLYCSSTKKANIGAIYHPNFNGSFSIKAVLPSFFPNFTYKNLKVQDGKAAKYIYKQYSRKLITSKKWIKEIRQNMLDYCFQDSLAMLLLYLRALQLDK